MQFDVVIVGASFAGLAAAKTAASRGLSVAVIEAKREAGARVHTSGILVREAMEEIDIPHRLTRRVPGVRLYAPNLKSVDLFSPTWVLVLFPFIRLLRGQALGRVGVACIALGLVMPVIGILLALTGGGIAPLAAFVGPVVLAVALATQPLRARTGVTPAPG